MDRSVRSCLDQILFNKMVEVIVVDDGSTDNSLRVLERFDGLIRLITNGSNKGVACTSNNGLKEATGDYVIRVDSDDFLNKFALYHMSEILDENDDIGFVYCDHHRVDELGFKEEKVKLDTKEKLYAHGAGILYRKFIIDEIGGYNEKLKNCEDYDLLLRLEKKTKGFYLPLPLYRYYIHGNNLSSSSNRIDYKKKVEEMHGI